MVTELYEPTYGQFQDGRRPPNFQSSNRCTLAVQMFHFISFGTEFDHVTHSILQMLKVKASNVKVSA